jgi:hypothetical protein
MSWVSLIIGVVIIAFGTYAWGIEPATDES